MFVAFHQNSPSALFGTKKLLNKYHSAKYAKLLKDEIIWYFSIVTVVLNIYTVPERQLIFSGWHFPQDPFFVFLI